MEQQDKREPLASGVGIGSSIPLPELQIKLFVNLSKKKPPLLGILVKDPLTLKSFLKAVLTLLRHAN